MGRWLNSFYMCDIMLIGFYYTYVLKSQKDKKLYVGHADDLEKRLLDHLEGRVTATRHRRPLDMIYFEACKNKEAAVAREKQLKTGFGRAYLKRRIIL